MTINDARVMLAISSISNDESTILKMYADLPKDGAFGFENLGFGDRAAIPRLLDKKIIRTVGESEEGHPAYTFTFLGRMVASAVKSSLPKFTRLSPKEDLDNGEQTK